MDSVGESAASAFVGHLRTVAENGPDYATLDALRDEAESMAAWALLFLKETGSVPPSTHSLIRAVSAEA